MMRIIYSVVGVLLSEAAGHNMVRSVFDFRQWRCTECRQPQLDTCSGAK